MFSGIKSPRVTPPSTLELFMPSKDTTPVVRDQVRSILDHFVLENIASHLLRRAHFKAEELFAAEFQDESVTPRQKAALIMLYQHPGMNQNSLAESLFMDRNTIAEMIRRLAGNHLIERRTDESDARAYELYLTAEGLALLDRMMERDCLVEQRLLERLPAEYRPLFLKCLRLIVQGES